MQQLSWEQGNMIQIKKEQGGLESFPEIAKDVLHAQSLGHFVS